MLKHFEDGASGCVHLAHRKFNTRKQDGPSSRLTKVPERTVDESIPHLFIEPEHQP